MRVLGEGEFLAGPSLTSPEDGASDVVGQMLLTWESVDGAAAYHVQVSTSRSFTPLVLDTSGVAGTSLDLPNLAHSTTYYWRVRGTSNQLPGAFSSTYSFRTEVHVSSAGDLAIPTYFALKQNYPNPFNPSTMVVYDVPEHARVRVIVFDVLGHEVARLIDKDMSPGRHEVRFEASSLPAGVYLLNMQAKSFMQTRSMVLVR